ncbi:protein-L-isoaspartate(D-aspartate) O-methyltransferase [Ancylobacter dichloromethanicus]|uniref:Protein-L-isoaspartate O-methyltransferase n=1 Tax=Ancylobacter dichloromethanicus TaxID=518825 RepID=A0A9W6J6H5_9HYPH|nr:protein-L-isoaspartate(D-aspartate) O-methyltransferase [Ancylobacter dichloromethanicus]MBS7554141.1 protein-L-isoaspartate(D-aspartate) O-methyltransferase [Ancylobacter dichloromethanicus]GLK71257.1 protein-L-isoaspartate O-methyltransferase [Ancylobacter dichloromethanicus]
MSDAGENEDLQRAELLLALRKRGLRDRQVMRAIEQVPRERFVEPAFRPVAWRDLALPIDCGQTISQPTVVALMTEALELGPSHSVLEVGTGSGYQSAILANIAGHVVSVERFRTLADAAARRLASLGIANVEVLVADGRAGVPQRAPFDRILLTAAVEQVPPALFEQLAMGGILVAPVGPAEGTQFLMRYRRGLQGLETRELALVRFVPMLPGIAAVL